VGMFLALRLADFGVSVRVLERHARARPGTRSLGIHPPGLARLQQLGIGDELVREGVRVCNGHVFLQRQPRARVALASRVADFPFVLSVPQPITERLLQETLQRQAPEAYLAGCEVEGVHEVADGIVLEIASAGRRHTLRAKYAVACDGRRSAMRLQHGIRFVGSAYPGRYAMCDAPDSTDLGSAAGIFIHREGLVEALPLPNGARRWVVRRSRDAADDRASLSELEAAIRRRTPYSLHTQAMSPSDFVCERFLAERLVDGRLVLAGDAAHVVSPIGGQGLNLGWLGAWTLAAALHRALAGEHTALVRDAQLRTQLARKVARRAELNMWLGRPGADAGRSLMLRALSRWPFAEYAARMFTMGDLVEDPPSHLKDGTVAVLQRVEAP
jgi:2-polyprenyl-6-methoxyphenol hydroxylase-like FAD-dependent oxidoreductase